MELLLHRPNFLLLDDVSNDLAVGTLTNLEEVLVGYTGVVLLCSHDRVMLDRLVDHVLVPVLEGGGATRLVEGKFTDFLAARKGLEAERKRERKTVAVESGAERKAVREADAKRRMSYKEKREYEGLEAEIDKAQAECEDISRRLESEATTAGYEELMEWSSRLAELEADVERKTERWMELAELADLAG